MLGHIHSVSTQASSLGQQATQRNFEEIYSDNVGIVQYVLSKFRFPVQELEDLTQEIFLRYFEVRNTIQHKNPRSYLLTAARNIGIDQYRKQKRNFTESQYALDEGMDYGTLWIDDPIRKQERNAVQEFMKEIRHDPEAETLVLFYDEDLSVKEIAKKLDESTGTITSRLSRLRKKYQKILEFHLETMNQNPCFG